MSNYHTLHLKATEANGTHIRFSVFMNHAYCGELTMRENEAIFFHDLVLMSDARIKGKDSVISSGHWVKEEKEEKDGTPLKIQTWR